MAAAMQQRRSRTEIIMAAMTPAPTPLRISSTVADVVTEFEPDVVRIPDAGVALATALTSFTFLPANSSEPLTPAVPVDDKVVAAAAMRASSRPSFAMTSTSMVSFWPRVVSFWPTRRVRLGIGKKTSNAMKEDSKRAWDGVWLAPNFGCANQPPRASVSGRVDNGSACCRDYARAKTRLADIHRAEEPTQNKN